MSEQTINKPSNNIVTDTEEFLKNLTPEQRDTLRLMRHALRERDGKIKRMLQKIVSSALGILKDPEL